MTAANKKLDIKKVEKWLEQEKENIIENIKKLVGYESVCSQPQENMPFGKECYNALTWFLELAGKIGFETKNHQGYCGSIFYGSGSKTLGLVSHLDVVEAGAGWTYEPFKAEIFGDYIVGRGTQDNKGAAIGALYAMNFLKDNCILPKNKVQLIVGCNEESGMSDIKFFLKNNKSPDFSLVTDCGFPVCCGEKGHIKLYISFDTGKEYFRMLKGGIGVNTVADRCKVIINSNEIADTMTPEEGEKITIICKGNLVEIEAVGKSAHASVPHTGENAIAYLFEYISKINFNDEKVNKTFGLISEIAKDYSGEVLGINCMDEESGPLTISAGTIILEGNIIKMGMDIRYPVTEKGSDVICKLKRYCENNQIGIVIDNDSPPYYIDKNDKRIEYLTGTFNSLTRNKTFPYTMGGGTHARVMPNAVGYGIALPNTENAFNEKGRGLYHQPDEALHIPSLIEGIKVYIYAICGIEL